MIKEVSRSAFPILINSAVVCMGDPCCLFEKGSTAGLWEKTDCKVIKTMLPHFEVMSACCYVELVRDTIFLQNFVAGSPDGIFASL